MTPACRVDNVEELWEQRYDLMQPNKRKRLRRFYDAFPPVIAAVHANRSFDADAMRADPYFEYLRCYHKSWQEEPLSQAADAQMRNRFLDAINLYNDIKQNGMRDPLELICPQMEHCHIIRGYRRLVILHVLDVKTAEVLHHASFWDYLAYHNMAK